MKLRRSLLSVGAIAALMAPLVVPTAASAHDGRHDDRRGEPRASLLVDGLASANGSTVGPDGALYVAVAEEGKILRVHPRSGNIRTFAEGLPLPLPEIGYGGVVDVVFRKHTAYALVTFVDQQFGGTEANGVYRIDDRDDHTLIADLSAWSREEENLPPAPIELEGGNPFAIESVRGGFLVTDGNHNRLLHISKRGHIEEVVQFDNVVPTGLEVNRKKIYVGQAGPIPHAPETGRVISLNRWDLDERLIASGYPLIVDVEFGKCGRLFALSNGRPDDDPEVAEPAAPDTGALLRVKNGEFRPVVEELDRPTSVDFIRGHAYITTLEGEVWRVKGLGGCGHHRH
jgi:hypothetical protein